jgi:hypothetical protein
MADDITAMLVEAKLPPSYWEECAAAMVHVWNRLPTAALPHMTPYEAWYKRKPDVSYLRVWGCTAYVFVQKDKQKSLAPHMEKCIFLGYPDGYKGWKFYNPTTKKVIISEVQSLMSTISLVYLILVLLAYPCHHYLSL